MQNRRVEIASKYGKEEAAWKIGNTPDKSGCINCAICAARNRSLVNAKTGISEWGIFPGIEIDSLHKTRTGTGFVRVSMFDRPGEMRIVALHGPSGYAALTRPTGPTKPRRLAREEIRVYGHPKKGLTK